MSTKITTVGRRLAIKPASLSTTMLKLLRCAPSDQKWMGGLFTVTATCELLEWVQKNFADAKWTPEASLIAQQTFAIRDSALPMTTAPRIKVYQPKTKPFDHQARVFNDVKDKEVFALFWEQGTGKAKEIIDEASYLYAQGKIDGLLVVAFPNGVHDNWDINEIPAHMPDWCTPIVVAWDAQKGERKIKAFKENKRGLRVLLMNIEALSTKRAEKVCRDFLTSYTSMFAIDESTCVKTPSAQRTKAVLRLRALAPYRRIATGTPSTKGPLDLYSQFAFLDESILGFSSFYTFKQHYAIMKPLPGKLDKRNRPIEIVVGYQNIEELQAKIKPYSDRVLKSECFDLPPKLYEPVYIKLTKAQTEHYERLKEEFETEFRGKHITAPLAITRLLRLHQVVCGFLPTDDPENDLGAPIDEKNPRLEALMHQLELEQGKAIIFANYRFSLREIWNALVERFGKESVVAYTKKDGERVKRLFQDRSSSVRFIVGQTRALAYGHTLTAANSVHYYCNNFSLEIRQQSEDRPHRAGLDHPVTYYDYQAQGTVETHIIKTLRSNREISAMITGDKLLQWI